MVSFCAADMSQLEGVLDTGVHQQALHALTSLWLQDGYLSV